MARAARGSRADSVNTNHGCDKSTRTEGCSTDTFINGIGAVRLWDNTAEHKVATKIKSEEGKGEEEEGEKCVPHTVQLTVASTKVFINGRGAGRVGDKYGGSEEIVTGSSNVFFG